MNSTRYSSILALGLLVTFGYPSQLYANAALGTANAFNVFVFNNLSLTGSDTGGRIAVGGNASFPGWYATGGGILDTLTTVDNLTLDVAGSITAGPAGVYTGNAYVGTAGASYAYTYHGAETVGGKNPIDIAGQYSYLNSYATQLSQLTANSSATYNSNGLTLTGTDPTLEVFNVSGSELNKSINFNVASGATIVINVSGASVTTGTWGDFWNGTQIVGDSATMYEKVIFNFYQANNLTLAGTFEGTVLAPNAAVTGLGGQLDGGLIAQSFTGPTEFHDLLFTGTTSTGQIVSATPEPATFAICGVVLIALSLAGRRRRSK